MVDRPEPDWAPQPPPPNKNLGYVIELVSVCVSTHNMRNHMAKLYKFFVHVVWLWLGPFLAALWR